jgi:hypothetical protein
MASSTAKCTHSDAAYSVFFTGLIGKKRPSSYSDRFLLHMFATNQYDHVASIINIESKRIAAFARCMNALEAASKFVCNECSMFTSIVEDVLALKLEEKVSIYGLFFVYTPRIDKLLLEYIDVCGGDDQSWVRYSKDRLFKDAYACNIDNGSQFHYLEQPTRCGAGALLEPSDYAQNMRLVASMLLNLLLALRYQASEDAIVPVAVQCWIYGIDQYVEYSAKTDAGTLHVSWFMQRHRIDDEQSGGDDECALFDAAKNAIIDAYRCKGRRFDPFDTWLTAM